MDRQHLGAKSLASAPAATRVVAEWSPITSVERNGGRGRLSQTDLETWEVQDSQFLNVYLYILQYFQLVVGDPWRQRVSRSRESKEKGFIRKAPPGLVQSHELPGLQLPRTILCFFLGGCSLIGHQMLPPKSRSSWHVGFVESLRMMELL